MYKQYIYQVTVSLLLTDREKSCLRFSGENGCLTTRGKIYPRRITVQSACLTESFSRNKWRGLENSVLFYTVDGIRGDKKGRARFKAGNLSGRGTASKGQVFEKPDCFREMKGRECAGSRHVRGSLGGVWLPGLHSSPFACKQITSIREKSQYPRRTFDGNTRHRGTNEPLRPVSPGGIFARRSEFRDIAFHIPLSLETFPILTPCGTFTALSNKFH